MADLTLRRVDMAQALPMLAPAIRRGDTTAGAAGLGELLADSQAFTLEEAGKPAVYLAMKVQRHEKSAVLWIMAAAGGLPGCDLTAEGLQVIEREAAGIGAAQVAITTRRRGLVKKLQAQGYEITGYTLRKKIA